ncbi:excisionase family DNA binding protein [Saccharothrix coeruleofusca]|uniref:helix-turn-helix domain-containing protein n=1 Tax=Saccharothrix coeruleofusca TaxID=33919 RepID=UPI001FD45A98|nr:helix-turn-helix domain-containing protein [Saccharothrix coeruleofusca]MBP2340285.1 excisionase family DNA binding protein [Saccharothrix coeruleofusca]
MPKIPTQRQTAPLGSARVKPHDSPENEGKPMSDTSNVTELAKYLYKVPEAMRLLSLSRSTFYEQMRAGRIKFVKQGSATLIPASAIRSYVTLLEREAGVHLGETA